MPPVYSSRARTRQRLSFGATSGALRAILVPRWVEGCTHTQEGLKRLYGVAGVTTIMPPPIGDLS